MCGAYTLHQHTLCDDCRWPRRHRRELYAFDYENMIHNRCGGAIHMPGTFDPEDPVTCENCGEIHYEEIAVRIVRVGKGD
jgi:hypothetical protein